jgi:hypothetical protein
MIPPNYAAEALVPEFAAEAARGLPRIYAALFVAIYILFSVYIVRALVREVAV